MTGVIPEFRLWVLGSTTLALASILVVLAWRTDMLRDSGPFVPPAPGARPTFSLARVQLALWTFSVIVGFLLLWVVNGKTNGIIPTTILGFLGISVGTALGGSLIDNAPARPAPAPDAPAPDSQVSASRGLWQDILSDGNAITLHRLQMVLWSLVVITIFWADLVQQASTAKAALAMPDFHTSLLAIMGITHGTYLGMKTME